MEGQLSVSIDRLAELDLFAGCAPDDLGSLAEAIVGEQRLAEGEVLCREGEQADRWWIVADGTAEITIEGLYVATVGPGESVGELALLDQEPRNATVTASSDLQVHEVDGKRFLETLRASPPLMVALLRQLAVRLRAADQRQLGPGPPAPAVVHVAPAAPRAEVAVTFNPFAPGFLADPYEQYALLRAHDPVHLDQLTGAYVLTRYDDVHRLSRDRSLSVAIDRAAHNSVVDAELQRDAAVRGTNHRMMLRRDGEDHAHLRQLVARVFTPKAIAAWRTRTAAVVDDLLASLAERDVVDVIEDFALLFPSRIISEMLGMPCDDVEQLRSWSLAMTKTFDLLNTPPDEAASVQATREMAAFVADVIADKRRRADDDILSTLIAAQENDPALHMDDVVAQVILLYVAGHENAMNLVGNGLVHLLEFPEQFDLLRSDRALDANAMEEITRFDTPVQFSRRVTLAPLEIRDKAIPAGSMLLLGLGAANRDPDKWGPSADLLELARPRANEHAAFGGGPHHCLGSALARLEAQVALPKLVRRFPRMVSAAGRPDWEPRVTLRGLRHLPVSLHP
ncbi:MAG TPA: cytochrome P450 [Acidimicrobiales bacterium]|nr:cytochrome P450 [Acidimicrobiales bacterium]